MSKDYRDRSRSRNRGAALPSRVYTVPLPQVAASMLLTDQGHLLKKVRNRFQRVDISCNTHVSEPRLGFYGSDEEEVKNAMFYLYDNMKLREFVFSRLQEEASRIGLKGYADYVDDGMKKEQADEIDELKMKNDENERKLSRIIESKEHEIKIMNEKVRKVEEEIKKQDKELSKKDKKIREQNVEIQRLTKVVESVEVGETGNGSKKVLNDENVNEEIISKLTAENQELKEKVSLNEQIDKQLDASGNQMVKELQEKIELLQDKKERSEDLNNNASLKYQKLVKANDELKNKVLLYKGMVSLRDQELKLLKGKGRSPSSDDEDALEEIKIDD